MADKQRVIALDYSAYPAFVPFHNRFASGYRYGVLVCHRRAGKTVAAINDILYQALHADTSIRKNYRYGYVAPLLKQSKELAWTYLKDAVADFKDLCKINESELYVLLPNGARIKLYGADKPDSLRGGYFDGVVLDEFGDMKAEVWDTIVRPMLADRKGWAVFMGTPKGKNEFFNIREVAKNDTTGAWYHLNLKSSQSGHIEAEELEQIKLMTPPDVFEAEYECSFEAAIKGSYYAELIKLAEDEGRIKKRLDPVTNQPVHVVFDPGWTDNFAAWFFQVIAGEIRLLDYYETNNTPMQEVFEDLAGMVDRNGHAYDIEKLWLPHDTATPTFQTGKSMIEQIMLYGYEMELVPYLSVRDGIQAVRMTLEHCYFDEELCYKGLDHLRSYKRKWDRDKKVYSEKPDHDSASHGADAFRYLCLSVTEDVRLNNKKTARKNKEIVLAKKAAAAEAAKHPEELNRQYTSFTFDQLMAAQPRRAGRTRI